MKMFYIVLVSVMMFILSNCATDEDATTTPTENSYIKIISISDSSFSPGESISVRYETDFSSEFFVTLQLFKSDTLFHSISNTSSHLSSGWTIPYYVPIGFDYKIKVSIKDNDNFYDISENFSIKGSINLITPNGMQTILAQNEFNILWEDNLNEKIKITLNNEYEKVFTISDSTESDGKYLFNFPINIVEDGNYFISISSLSDSNIFDKSDSTICVINNTDSSNFIMVKGGMFEMGDYYGDYTASDDRESPVHYVIVSDFYISKYEITQKDWSSYLISPTLEYGFGDSIPIYHISWYSTLVYCNKRSIAENLTPCYSILGSSNPNDWGDIPTDFNQYWNDVICDFNANGYRLPTEAEWEYAARGGEYWIDRYRFSGCQNDIDLNNYSFNRIYNYTNIGTKLPNQLGIYDMSGNVEEMCWDWFDFPDYYYYDECFNIGTVENPKGPVNGLSRILRGFETLNTFRVSGRAGCAIGNTNIYNGFRVVRTSMTK